MTILLWNCKSIGRVKFRRYAKELIFVNKVKMLIIVEPRISRDTADNVIRELRFDGHTKVDAVGFSGGIWIFWRNNIGSVQVYAKESQILSIVITGTMGRRWGFNAVYASLVPLSCNMLWNYLK
ncbi:hypothetical protein REPUB_Repub05bG0137700 [Reevesia pubescens]